MKKIIGAALVAALAAGVASADVTVNINSRTRPSLFTMSKTYADNSKKTTVMDFSNTGHNDDFTFKASADYAGITAKLTLENSKASYNGTEAVGTMGETGTAQAIKLGGEYYGWLNWGAFKVTAGVIDTRITNRYNQTVVEEGLTDSDTAKWGVSNNIVYGLTSSEKYEGSTEDLFKSPTMELKENETAYSQKTLGKSFLYDFNNITAIGGTRHTGIMLDYALADVLPGKLNFKAVAFATNFSNNTEDVKKKDEYTQIGAAFNGEITYTQNGIGQFDVVFKKPTENTWGIGAYFDLKAVENLSAAIGFTYGQSSEYDVCTKWDKDPTKRQYTTMGKWNAYAIEGRAFYNITPAFKIGAQVKFSAYNNDGEKIASSKTSLTPTPKYKDNGTLDKYKYTQTETTTYTNDAMSLEAILSAQYMLNDTIALQLDGGIYMEDLTDDVEGDLAENYIKIRPAAKFTAGKNAAITTAFEFQTAINGGDADDAKYGFTKTKMAVPVIMRVKL